MEDQFQLNEAADFIRRAKNANPFSIDNHTVEFAAGELVFREGDLGEAMYVVLEGEVAVIKKLENGSSRLLQAMKKGDFFGEMSLIDKKRRSASAICQSDRVKLVRIPEGKLVDFIEKNPHFAIKMLNTFVARLRHSNQIIEKAIVRDPSAVVLDGLQEFARLKGLRSEVGWRVSVPEFSSWADYRLGVPERQIPEILGNLVETSRLCPGLDPDEVVLLGLT